MANLAAANLMHRKTRTAVSVMAVAVEVAMVMIIVGMANGTIGDIANRLENVGADVLFQPPDASLILGATTAVMPVKYIDIMKEVDGVREVTPVLNWLVSRIQNQQSAVNLWSVDYPSFAAISGGLDIVEGRALEQPYDVVMDTILSSSTGVGAGDTLSMINREFKVVGICRAGAGGRLYARIQDVQDAVGTPGKASFFLIKGESARDADKLTQALRDRFKGHKITPMAQVSQVMQSNVVGLQQFKQALTLLAVVISFLVVLLAMYTSIIERTREIGILRAIGADQRRVVDIVVRESMLICALGVVVGISLAMFMRFLLPVAFPTLQITLSQDWALIAAALGMTGGLLGSIYPALRAARMDPIYALNFE